MSQNQKLREHLKRYGKVSNIEAIRRLYILRLSERIRELQQGGWKFRKYYTDEKRTRYIYELLSN